MSWNRIAAVPLLVVAAAGCSQNLPGPIACTDIFVYGLAITVLDEAGDPAVEGAIGVAVDGTYQETLMEGGPDLLVGAGERAGEYDLAITKEGYVTWTMADVEVDEDECHVIPVEIEATLVPAP